MGPGCPGPCSSAGLGGHLVPVLPLETGTWSPLLQCVSGAICACPVTRKGCVAAQAGGATGRQLGEASRGETLPVALQFAAITLNFIPISLVLPPLVEAHRPQRSGECPSAGPYPTTEDGSAPSHCPGHSRALPRATRSPCLSSVSDVSALSPLCPTPSEVLVSCDLNQPQSLLEPTWEAWLTRSHGRGDPRTGGC